MRALPALALFAVAAGAAWWLVRPWGEDAPPTPDPTSSAPAPPPAEKGAGMLRPAAFGEDAGVLVVRVRTKDGRALPAKVVAGFTAADGVEHLRTVVDGAVRFSDAPLGKLEVTAEAEGWWAAPVPVVVMAEVPAEAVVELAPREGKPK